VIDTNGRMPLSLKMPFKKQQSKNLKYSFYLSGKSVQIRNHKSGNKNRLATLIFAAKLKKGYE